MKRPNVRHVQKINSLTRDMRISIPGDMDTKEGEYYLFERVDDKTIKMTKLI